ncbi:MAG: DsrE family protein [Rhodocyclaceae bacterium]|nr:DsrE family protein [Rhodocyclaceae bacterium]
MSAQKTRLALLLWSADPERPELCAAPFVHATAAAAIDCEVEIHFSGRAVRLLVAGVADRLHPSSEREVSVLHFMRQAADLGVTFLACAMALKAHVAADEILIAEYGGTAGAAAFVARALDPDWATLVY